MLNAYNIAQQPISVTFAGLGWGLVAAPEGRGLGGSGVGERERVRERERESERERERVC